jgi:hypothetical protein
MIPFAREMQDICIYSTIVLGVRIRGNYGGTICWINGDWAKYKVDIRQVVLEKRFVTYLQTTPLEILLAQGLTNQYGRNSAAFSIQNRLNNSAGP